MAPDDRVVRFARGQLAGAELEAFERDLDESEELRRAVAHLASTDQGLTALPSSAPASTSEPLHPGLTVQRELGRGGMARVFLARQHELERDVAVKMTRVSNDAGLTARLKKEARLTGALEHPAIVPVHALSTDEAGELQVVLKRVEGEPWSSLMFDAETVQRRFGQELQDWNLRVLVTVCGALAFAHERGVIHRDLKPNNVMIGRHAEVYVMDWGLGGLLERDPADALPWVGDSVGAGTPAYMAPEQLAMRPLSPATDVYLLGGVLFELLTGSAPFVHRSGAATPAEDTTIPPHPALRGTLEEVVRTALDPAPERRYPTAKELQLALERCLRSRDSERVCHRGKALLELARRHRAEGRHDDATQAAMEAGFSLRTARELWAGNVESLQVADELVTFQVEAALADGHPAVADQALSIHPRPLPGLQARVATALAETKRREALARELDPSIGRRHRLGFLASFMGLMLVFYGVRFSVPALYVGRWALVVSSLLFLVGFLGISFAFRGFLATSKLNRQLTQLIIVVTAGQIAMRAASAALLIPRDVGAVLEFPVILTTLLGGAIAFHWSFAVGAVVCAVGQAIALGIPSSGERIFALSALAAVGSIGLVWQRVEAWRSGHDGDQRRE